MDTTQSQWPQGIGVMEVRKARAEKDEALKCPRCNSSNTKFCYYNNYSLSQPRYFCKTCRRYWTAGGSLRNVPVGGASRKNKRSSSSKINHDHVPLALDQNPSKIHFQAQDLNLATSAAHLQLPQYQNPNSSSAMELFKTRGLMSMPGSNGFNPNLQDLKPSGALNFSLDSTIGARLLFPFEDSNGRDSTAAGYWTGMLGGGSW